MMNTKRMNAMHPAMAETFESLCRKQWLAQIKNAVHPEPANVELRRTRPRCSQNSGYRDKLND